MPKTRVTDPIFGTSSELNPNVLPTYSDVMRGFLWQRECLKFESDKDPSVLDISKKLLIDIKKIWQRASLPTISDQQIIQKIKDYNEKCKSLKKNQKSAYNKKCLEKIEVFKKNSSKLFDISPCKCDDFSKCHCKVKVPLCERIFLLDQRTTRKMMIGGTDVKTTKQNLKTMKRKVVEEERLEKKKSKNESILDSVLSDPESIRSSEGAGENIDEGMTKNQDRTTTQGSEHPSSSKGLKVLYNTGLKLTNLAEACDRVGVSDRSASLITNAVLKDLGLITKEDTTKIIDRSKIRRERKKCRTGLIKQKTDDELPSSFGIYFDGRKDRTLVFEKTESSQRTKSVTEEHIVILAEPGSKYMGHVSPENGTAKSIKDSITKFLKDSLGDDLSTIDVIGCDGTVVNTGFKNGVIRQIELSLGKPVQWFICLLHANELPLRHLVQQLDGKTNDPRGFTGTIGKLLDRCEQMAVVDFEKIHAEFPVVNIDELSTDQKYLYEMCIGIKSGLISSQLAERHPGKISHSRWLTTANRILRLYISTKDPSSQLKILAEYVVNVYATTWFRIKFQSSCKYGAKHLYHMIKSSRYLPSEIKKIVDPVIQRNGYFAHPENVLVAMLADDRKHIRELSLRRILKCRSQNRDEIVREFKVPPINFDAQEYFDLVDWQSVELTEPPIIKNVSDDKLSEMILHIPDEIDILKFPCHTQAVERHIKLVTEASSLVCGTTSRDGLIRARISSRQKMPKVETKKHFCE